MEGLVGILGGMGPSATAAFYTRLVEVTPAECDQDHIPVVMWADPTVPDRTAAFEGHGESVVPWLERGVRALRQAGAGLVACPCNTAHVWLPDVAHAEGVELVSIIDATVDAVGARAIPGAAVGLLGTDATLASGLYQRALSVRGFRPLTPSPATQKRLVDAIYKVKVGTPTTLAEAAHLVERVGDELTGSGAAAIVSGCTEVSVLLGRLTLRVPAIDSMEALAHAVVRRWSRVLASTNQS